MTKLEGDQVCLDFWKLVANHHSLLYTAENSIGFIMFTSVNICLRVHRRSVSYLMPDGS